MSAVCPEGHTSDESDYCSVCGMAIPQGAAPARAAGPAAASKANRELCPVCSEPRDEEARFCEVCRFDFLSRPAASTAVPPPRTTTPAPGPAAPSAALPRPAPPAIPGGPPSPFAPSPSFLVSSAPHAPPSLPSTPATPSTPAPAATPAAPATSAAPAGPFGGRRRWQLTIAVDPSLDTEPDTSQPCPTGQVDLLIDVDLPEMLLGRRDDRRDIRPEIPLGDPGTSRRHAKLVLSPDGSLQLQDLASTNGTKLNGHEVVPGSRRPLADRDEITLGRWTRITVRSP
jgi:predicted nucleic acid-binding Zn ribbon protein